MHSSKIIISLWSILQEGSLGNVCCWSGDGKRMLIKDIERVFKHLQEDNSMRTNKFEQLHSTIMKYGFHYTKTRTSSSKEIIRSYEHPYFQQNRGDLVYLMKAGKPTTPPSTPSTPTGSFPKTEEELRDFVEKLNPHQSTVLLECLNIAAYQADHP